MNKPEIKGHFPPVFQSRKMQIFCSNFGQEKDQRPVSHFLLLLVNACTGAIPATAPHPCPHRSSEISLGAMPMIRPGFVLFAQTLARTKL